MNFGYEDSLERDKDVVKIGHGKPSCDDGRGDIQSGARNVIPFYYPIKTVTS